MSQATLARPQDPSEGIKALLPLFALPLFGFLCFGLVIAVGIPSNRIGLAGLAIATGVVVLMVVAVDRMRPQGHKNLLLSLFSFSYVLHFVVPVFAFYLGTKGYDPELSPNPLPLTPHDVYRGMVAVLVAYATLLAGYVLPLGGGAARALPPMRREWSAETAIAVALVMISLGWAVMLLSQFGLIPQRAGSGVLGTIVSGTGFGIGLIALAYQRYRSPVALVLLALVIPPTMAFNFFTSSKYLFLLPIVMIAVVHVLATGRLRAWWFVGALIVMSLFYPVAQTYRVYLYDNHLSAVKVIASPQRAFGLMASVASTIRIDPVGYVSVGLESTGRRFDVLGILSVIIRDTGTLVPFQNGWSIAYIPLSYIPRLLWPGKPLFGTGQWTTDNYGWGPHIQTSTGASWIGELYFNFGWGGIIVGMFLLGIWFRFLQNYFLRADATIPAKLAGIVTILALVPRVGGDLLSATNGVVFNVVPIILAHLVLGVLAPPRTVRPSSVT